jgi:hypothetical protein
MQAPSELMIGLAGEHVVCADLLAAGHSAYRTEQLHAYDVVVDLGDRWLRLQVKTCGMARPFKQQKQRHVIGYSWSMRRGKSGANSQSYADGLVDGFALVALDIRRVAYILPGRQIFQMPSSGSRSLSPRRFEDYPFAALLEAHRAAV